MSYGEQERAIARQEFLEAMMSSLGSPACAPMPGTFLEMLEIAAAEHLQASEPTAEQAPEHLAPLTVAPNDSRMIGLWQRLVRAAFDVARRFRASSGARQVPV